MRIEKEVQELINTFKSFPRTSRIEKKEFSAYIRVTQRYIGNEKKNTIDIASIDVKEKYQGKGIFREILNEIEELAKNNNFTVFVECIHDKNLIEMFKRRNYIFMSEDLSVGAPNVYKTDFEKPKKTTKHKLK